jgi:hypothetical protein
MRRNRSDLEQSIAAVPSVSLWLAWPAAGLVDTWIRFSPDRRHEDGTTEIQPRVQLEAVKLVRDRGGAVAQACRDLDLAESVLRRWICETEADPRHTFPGHDQVKPKQQDN